jgi:N-acetyl sugar amidotransferase
MQKCTKCHLPETYETFRFNEEGTCNVCIQHETKHELIDWDQRMEQFEKLITPFRGTGDYDCIVPFSGGKDSTYVLHRIMNHHKLKPLVVSWDHGFYRPGHMRNVERTLKKLGADYLVFRPNMKVVGQVMLESLKRKGDFCWHCHSGIYAYPMQIAVKFKIPLLIWGESVSEYTGYYDFDEENWEEQDEEAFNRHVNLGIRAEDMLEFLPNLTKRDLSPYEYPKLRDLKKIGYKSILYGTFIKWDPVEQTKVIQDELGWEKDEVEGIPEEFSIEKLECRVNGIRDYLKYIKRGYSRTAQIGAREIRNGKMSSEEALKLADEHDGRRPESLDYFLKILNLTEKEFMEIALQHQISPWEFDENSVKKGPKLHDQDTWEDSPLVENL